MKVYGREYYLKKKYGITAEDVRFLLAQQGDACGICLSQRPGAHGWHVDHSHATGLFRGILCGNCNRALGLFRDQPELLQKAIKYLERPTIAFTEITAQRQRSLFALVNRKA